MGAWGGTVPPGDGLKWWPKWFGEPRVSISWEFSWLTARRDRCAAAGCGVQRQYHQYKDHKYLERGER